MQKKNELVGSDEVLSEEDIDTISREEKQNDSGVVKIESSEKND